MKTRDSIHRVGRGRLAQGAAFAVLALLGGLALAGPSGAMAWGENLSLLEKRQAQIVKLEAQRDELKNRVALLDPRHADPDLVGELLRKNLNGTRPDEVVITLD